MRAPSSVAVAVFVALARSAQAGSDPAPLRDQLVSGQRVKVEGQARDGVFRAQQVTLRDVEPTVKVEAAIAALSDGGRRLQLLDFVVTVDPTTRLYRGTQLASSRSILTRGSWIEAKGEWRDGVLKATRIRLKPAPEPTQEIEGTIQSAGPEGSTLQILGHHVVLPDDAAIIDERTGRVAQEQPDRLRRDDDDAGGRQPIAFGNVVVGGRLEAGFLDEQNFEVGERRADRTVLSRAQVIASTQLTNTIEAYGKVTLSRNLATDGPSQGDARLSEGYVMVHRIGGAPVDLQVGRQRFRDSREWFFDDYLDAARVHVTLPVVKLEASVSKGLFSGAEDIRQRRDQLQFLGSAVARVRGVQLGAYTLARRDTTRNERPVWIGGTVDGRAGIAWSYWADVANRRGTAGASRLSGWAADGGVKHKWSRRWSPTLTLGYAFGSGDRTKRDGVDTRFRQTDLEDNQAYFGGLRRVAIYGELFDPELSNLQVFTGGFGVRPRRTLTVDAIYHHFAQAIATSSLPSSNLDGALNGARRALGDELDLIVTLRAMPGVDLDLAVGAFVPGPAFASSRAPAFFWRPQLRVSF